MRATQVLSLLLSVGIMIGCDAVSPEDQADLPEAFASDIPHPLHNPVPRPVSPRNGQVLDNGCTDFSNPLIWDFDWDEVGGEDGYELYVKNEHFPNPVLNNLNVSASSYTLVLSAYTLSDEGWFYRVRAKKDGIAGNWSPEVYFNTEPRNTDCPWLVPQALPDIATGNGLLEN